MKRTLFPKANFDNFDNLNKFQMWCLNIRIPIWSDAESARYWFSYEPEKNRIFKNISIFDKVCLFLIENWWMWRLLERVQNERKCLLWTYIWNDNYLKRQVLMNIKIPNVMFVQMDSNLVRCWKCTLLVLLWK